MLSSVTGLASTSSEALLTKDARMLRWYPGTVNSTWHKVHAHVKFLLAIYGIVRLPGLLQNRMKVVDSVLWVPIAHGDLLASHYILTGSKEKQVGNE